MEESRNFLSHELLEIFIEILGHDATRGSAAVVAPGEEWNGSRPEIIEISFVQRQQGEGEERMSRCGSYRRLPKSVSLV